MTVHRFFGLRYQKKIITHLFYKFVKQYTLIREQFSQVLGYGFSQAEKKRFYFGEKLIFSK